MLLRPFLRLGEVAATSTLNQIPNVPGLASRVVEPSLFFWIDLKTRLLVIAPRNPANVLLADLRKLDSEAECRLEKVRFGAMSPHRALTDRRTA